MKSPLVSILIPVYNQEKYIGECIQSAFNQTYPNFEIIIVDNASSDHTWDICKGYAAIDQRIRIFRNDSNIGPVRNWMRCFDKAVGIYGKILFSDDLIAPDCLEKMVPYLEDHDVGLVFSSVEIGPEPGKGKLFYSVPHDIEKIDNNRFIYNLCVGNLGLLSPGAALFRLQDLKTNLILEIPSPSINDFNDHGAGPDLLLYLLTATKYPFVLGLKNTLVFFRRHEASISCKHQKDFISARYDQAKVWFANHISDSMLLLDLLTKIWMKQCIKGKRPVSFRKVCNQYLPSSYMQGKISIIKLLSCLIRVSKEIIINNIVSKAKDKDKTCLLR